MKDIIIIRTKIKKSKKKKKKQTILEQSRIVERSNG